MSGGFSLRPIGVIHLGHIAGDRGWGETGARRPSVPKPMCSLFAPAGAFRPARTVSGTTAVRPAALPPVRATAIPARAITCAIRAAACGARALVEAVFTGSGPALAEAPFAVAAPPAVAPTSAESAAAGTFAGTLAKATAAGSFRTALAEPRALPAFALGPSAGGGRLAEAGPRRTLAALLTGGATGGKALASRFEAATAGPVGFFAAALEARLAAPLA